MNTDTTEQDTAQETLDAPETTEQATEAPECAELDSAREEQQDDEQSKPSWEARKLRKRLRETEAERDTALEQVGQLRSTLLSAAMTDERLTPEALWAAGHKPEEFFTDDGLVDDSALKAAITETRSKFGIPRNGTPKPDPSQGISFATPRSTRGEWTDAFQYNH